MQAQREYILVLDFEANCSNEGVRDHEICEFPCVLLDVTGTNIGEFRTFVKPVRIHKISPFIHGLTGITDADVATGITWSEALVAFNTWCEEKGIHSGNTVVVTCGDWDLKTMLVRQHAICKTHASQPLRVRQLFEKWTNVKITYASYKKYKGLKGMDTMLRDTGLPLIGRHHSGIDDCRNIGQICKWLIDKGRLAELFAADRNRINR